MTRASRHALAVVAAALLLLPAASAQAAVPSASTGGTASVTSTSATLKGTVNPNSAATTYYWEYGPTKTYGTQTPAQGPTGATKTNIKVSAAVTGLTPGATYHYRLVATNASGTKLGGDKTFKTPGAISLAASPRGVVAGRPTSLSGQLAGATVAGVKVTLQQDGAPFDPRRGFGNVATTTTDSTGHYSFAQTPTVNTAYRVVANTRPAATSATVTVPVRVAVTMSPSTTHPKSGKRVVFRGTATPAHNGQLVRVQKRVNGRWRTVKSALLGPGSTAQTSKFALGIRVRKTGVYRAYVAGDFMNAAGWSHSRRIRVH